MKQMMQLSTSVVVTRFIVAVAVIGVAACSGPATTEPRDDHLQPVSPQAVRANASTEAWYGFSTCPRYGQIQTQPNCLGMKQIEQDLLLYGLQEASRLETSYSSSSVCGQVAVEIRRLLTNDLVYEVPRSFYDPVTGQRAGGDFHRDTGLPDQVHIARGYDELNLDPNPAGIRETFFHEAAHGIGIDHNSYPIFTTGAMSQCGVERVGGGGNPVGPQEPYAIPGPVMW